MKKYGGHKPIDKKEGFGDSQNHSIDMKKKGKKFKKFGFRVGPSDGRICRYCEKPNLLFYFWGTGKTSNGNYRW